MRVVRVAVVAAVLGLLGLLVWDVAHGSGPGVAQKVDKGRRSRPRISTCRASTQMAG